MRIITKKIVSVVLFWALTSQAGEVSSQIPGQTPAQIPVQIPTQRKYEAEEIVIPKSPSMPPSLTQRTPPEIPHCERYFTYRGNRIECDSQLGADAENLRPIIRDVPSAVAELDAYQRSQHHVRIAAYVGTLGIITTIAGATRPLTEPQTGALTTGAYLGIAGVLLTVNALLYGLSLTKANKVHIQNAIDQFNAVHPNDRIEPQFDTRIHF